VELSTDGDGPEASYKEEYDQRHVHRDLCTKDLLHYIRLF
jgi:hypothetical protein